MFYTYLPIIHYALPPLQYGFARHDIDFYFAGEAANFGSSVQLPIIKTHAKGITSEVSVKMYYTQPFPGMWNFSMVDQLSEKCIEYNKALHGHCVIWHGQNPDWLWSRLEELNLDDRYSLFTSHVRLLTIHLKSRCISIDILNEYGAVFEGIGWGYYLGRECAVHAFTTAREYAGEMKLFYNSFFGTDEDAQFAIDLLPVTDGIGVQLHLNTWKDYTELFHRVRTMANACKEAGKKMRFSEISVIMGDASDIIGVGKVYTQIVNLALEFPGTVTNFTTWGVKGTSWNGGRLLFDVNGSPNKAFWMVIEALK